METKRLIFFVVLSVAVLLAYQYFFVKPVPRPAQTPVATSQPAAPQNSPAQGQGTPAQGQTLDINSLIGGEEKKEQPEAQTLPPVDADLFAASEQITVVETSQFKATITNKGVGLKSFVLKEYRDDKKNPLDLVSEKVNQSGILPFHFSPFGSNSIFLFQLNQQYFHSSGQSQILLQNGEAATLVFEYANKEKNIKVKKAITFSDRSYILGIELSLIVNGKAVSGIPIAFGPDLENNVSPERTMLPHLKIGAYTGSELKSKDFGRIKTVPTAENTLIEKFSDSMGTGFAWAAYETNYFAAMFKTDFRNEVSYFALRQKVDKGKSNNFYYMIVQNPTQVYLGPKDERILAQVVKVFPDAPKAIEYGWFGAIAKILLKALNFIYRYVPNYGWAIIILTLLLKLILFPLTYSSTISMAKMQTLQPKIKVIKKKYKNTRDPEQRRQMNVEIMQLYKEEKVNPAGGCLPLLLQLPFLWGFFRMLSVSISVRHQPWIFWITDLSKKDPIYLLPILMAVTQIVSQKMQPSGGDETQKKLMYVTPVLFLLLFLSFPSGLNLYWAFSNVLQIGQQKIINDKIFKRKKEEDKERKIFKRKKGI